MLLSKARTGDIQNVNGADQRRFETPAAHITVGSVSEFVLVLSEGHSWKAMHQ